MYTVHSILYAWNTRMTYYICQNLPAYYICSYYYTTPISVCNVYTVNSILFSVCMSQTFAEIWCMHLRTLHGILFLTMQHAPCQWSPGQLDVSQRHPQWRPRHRQKTTGIRWVLCTIWLLCSLELNYWFIWPEENAPPDWAWFLPRFFLHFGMEHLIRLAFPLPTVPLLDRRGICRKVAIDNKARQ